MEIMGYLENRGRISLIFNMITVIYPEYRLKKIY